LCEKNTVIIVIIFDDFVEKKKGQKIDTKKQGQCLN
jgi:hypothetical protein